MRIQLHRRRYALPGRHRWLAGALIASLASATAPAQAQSPGTNPNELSVQINDDRMTLSVAKVPQIYLYGPIDAGAAQRVQALVDARKIPLNSDIYLNSPGGDVTAGIALGRLFRAGKMTTHLGSPRRTARQPIVPKSSQCIDACAYAYAGGLFRWAPTGSDRFGAQPVAANVARAADISAYLKDMGVDAHVFDGARPGEVTWLDADQMRRLGLANNGRLVPTSVYQPADGMATLSLTQQARDGEHKLSLVCRPDGFSITAYYTIGFERANSIVARASRTYIEVNDKPIAETEHVDNAVSAQSVVFTQPIASTQLGSLGNAYTMAAWLADRGGNVRYGFWMEMDPVRRDLRDFSQRCQQIVKSPAPAKG